MAYQNSYGARPHMYNSGGANAGRFPHQQLPHHQQQQQQQQFYPNPYPQSAAPSASYVQPQGSQGPANQVPRQPYLPHQSHGNAGPQLMPPPSHVPEDPFKKPYLPQQRTSEPQQQYIHNAQSPPFNPRYTQQPPGSNAPPISNISTTSREATQPTTTSLSYTPVSSMTAPAVPVISAQVTTPPESPSQPQDPSSQTNKSSTLDQERIDALLNVNNLLLQEVQILQKAGLKATAQSPQQANPANASSPQTKPEAATPTSTDPAEAASQNAPTPSSVTTPTTTTPTTLVPPQPANNPTQNQKKFVEYMGRLKANIYYLVAISNQEKTKQTPKPQYPALLELPPAWLAEGLKDDDYKRFEALKEGYVKLRELWPDWKPTPRPTPQQLAQQHLQQLQQQQQAQQQQAPQQSASQQQTPQQPALQQAQLQQAQQQHPQIPQAQQQPVQQQQQVQ